MIRPFLFVGAYLTACIALTLAWVTWVSLTDFNPWAAGVGFVVAVVALVASAIPMLRWADE